MNDTRRSMKAEFGENTRRTRGMMIMLNNIAQGERSEMNEKYRMKIKTLKEKHLVDKDTKTDLVPPDLKDYKDAKIFSKDKYNNIETDEIMIVRVGEINLSREEELIIKKHPKFALLENLKIEDLELDFEIGFGKYRYTLNGEMREKKERDKEKEKTGIGDKKELTAEERQEMETTDAKSKQAFDPIEKTYDARNIRVTDLEIKGLPEDQEAWLEIRRPKYAQV